ncbi:early endosome antigen 1-like [Drosophila obscura]|uniref:early endosome antigen 1-like n=1 Tax=Drosophila obscura TaxID=7282 RepID=UPI001BB29C13|nr:early endosome antigen 1-like [Drosophila obscura]
MTDNKASNLRTLSNNIWAENQESSPPPTPLYSGSGTPGVLNSSKTVSMPIPAMDSDHEPKTDPMHIPAMDSDHEPKTDPMHIPAMDSDHEPKTDPMHIPAMDSDHEPRTDPMHSQPAAEQSQSHASTEYSSAMDAHEDECQMEIIEQNRQRDIERKYQTLISIQTDFVQSLESLEPHESQMLDSYKFLPLVFDEKSKKSLVKNDDSILNLPTESVQDLKDRCHAAVDSGFMLLYDQVEDVQLANDEFEASQQKDKLLVKLKALQLRKMANIVENIDLVCGSTIGQQDAHNKHIYREIYKLRKQKEFMESRILNITKDHSEQLYRLQAALEEKLKAKQSELAKLQQLLSECEAQRDEHACRLETLNKSLRSKDNTIESVMAESNKQMSLNVDLEHLLEEASAELVRTRKEVENSREHIAFLESEWKENRKHRSEDDEQDKQHEQEEKGTLPLFPLPTCGISVQQVLSDLEHVKSQLYKSQKLVGELRARSNRDQTMICNYTDELNSCRVKDVESRRTHHTLYLETADKDMQISEMRHKLDAKEEQLCHAFGKLDKQEQDIRRLEEFKKVAMEENARIAQERQRQQEAKNEGQQKIEKLKQELQQFVDFLIYKGKPPAIVDGLIHVCSICGCIHQRNLDPQMRIQIQSQMDASQASHGVYFEALHHQLAKQQQQQQEQRNDPMQQHECHTFGQTTPP